MRQSSPPATRTTRFRTPAWEVRHVALRTTLHSLMQSARISGDITAPIYKWAAQQAGTSAPGLRRSKSLISIDRPKDRRPSRGEYDAIFEPGGFRREFVIRRMAENGNPAGTEGGGGRFTRSFVDFLSLYGHFGGEDLEEEDDEESDELDEEDDMEGEENFIPEYTGGSKSTMLSRTAASALNRERVAKGVISERSPLVRRSSVRPPGPTRAKSRSRIKSVGEHGDASVTQAVMMLLKSFVGTGVLFLGKACVLHSLSLYQADLASSDSTTEE